MPVYDVGKYQHAVFIAMELVRGLTLDKWARAERRPWREVLAMYLQAGRGLEAAHAAGLVHRDFKPANVLIGEDQRPRVTDFGIARSTRAAEPVRAAGLATGEQPGAVLPSTATTAGFGELASLPGSGSGSLDAPLTRAG